MPVKVTQLAARDKTSGNSAAAWTPPASVTVGAGDGFPYLSLGKGKTINSTQDNSINSLAYMDIPRQTGKYVEKSLSMYARYFGLNDFYYWAMGFELAPKKVCVFIINTPSVAPVAGAVYSDVNINRYTFLRKEVSNTNVSYYIFAPTYPVDTAVPTLQTGNLTKDSGTGDATLTFTAHSVLMYEHTYELDSRNRHATDFETFEQISGYQAGDKKNRRMDFAVKMGVTDLAYPMSMCKSLNFKSSAGQLAEMSFDFCAIDEIRGDFNSAAWTLQTDLIDSSSIMSHHQMKVELGSSETSMSVLGCTDIDFSIGIPLQIIQDTTTGLYIAEPMMEGKYDMSCNFTLSRYGAETWQAVRDAFSTVCARISTNYGYYMTEVLVNSAKISEAGPDDSDVAKENIVLNPGYSGSNAFSTWLQGTTLIHNSPILLRVRDISSTHQMFT